MTMRVEFCEDVAIYVDPSYFEDRTACNADGDVREFHFANSLLVLRDGRVFLELQDPYYSPDMGQIDFVPLSEIEPHQQQIHEYGVLFALISGIMLCQTTDEWSVKFADPVVIIPGHGMTGKWMTGLRSDGYNITAEFEDDEPQDVREIWIGFSGWHYMAQDIVRELVNAIFSGEVRRKVASA